MRKIVIEKGRSFEELSRGDDRFDEREKMLVAQNIREIHKVSCDVFRPTGVVLNERDVSELVFVHNLISKGLVATLEGFELGEKRFQLVEPKRIYKDFGDCLALEVQPAVFDRDIFRADLCLLSGVEIERAVNRHNSRSLVVKASDMSARSKFECLIGRPSGTKALERISTTFVFETLYYTNEKGEAPEWLRFNMPHRTEDKVLAIISSPGIPKCRVPATLPQLEVLRHAAAVLLPWLRRLPDRLESGAFKSGLH